MSPTPLYPFRSLIANLSVLRSPTSDREPPDCCCCRDLFQSLSFYPAPTRYPHPCFSHRCSTSVSSADPRSLFPPLVVVHLSVSSRYLTPCFPDSVSPSASLLAVSPPTPSFAVSASFRYRCLGPVSAVRCSLSASLPVSVRPALLLPHFPRCFDSVWLSNVSADVVLSSSAI